MKLGEGSRRPIVLTEVLLISLAKRFELLVRFPPLWSFRQMLERGAGPPYVDIDATRRIHHGGCIQSRVLPLPPIAKMDFLADAAGVGGTSPVRASARLLEIRPVAPCCKRSPLFLQSFTPNSVRSLALT